MATYTGAIVGAAATWEFPGRSANLDGFAAPLWEPAEAGDPSVAAGGALSDTQPVVERAAALDGGKVRSFSDDFYHRIWITPSRVDLGNLIGAVSRPVEVWNAYLTPKTLRAVTVTGADGLDLVQPVTPPYVWRGLEVHTYTLNVSATGLSRLAAIYVWDWTDELRALPVSGQRIVAWPWLPNWREPVRERLSWLTEVLTAWGGREQRIRLRDLPRQDWEFTVTAQDGERRRIQAALWGWQGRAWALPIWPDGSRLSAAAQAGDLALACATAERGWRAGGLVLLTDGASAEVAYLSAVAGPAGLDLAAELLSDWPAGTRVYPARIARIQSVAPRQVHTPELSEWSLAWETDDLSDGWDAQDGPDSYRGAPVLTQRPNWRSGIAAETQRAMEVLDGLTGSRTYTDRVGRPRDLARLAYVRRGRADIAALKRVLYARAGRWTGLWVPTFERDLVLVSGAASGDTSLDVGLVDYTRYLVDQPGRQDIRILKRDGTRVYARISAAEVLDAATERLTLSGPIGAVLTPETTAQISFLRWSRLGADAVELLYRTPEVAETVVAFEGVDDV